MANRPRTGHSIGQKPGDIHFPRGVGDSTLNCICGVSLAAPTPYLLECEWAEHRGQRAPRPAFKPAGYLYGGAFK